MLIEDHPTVPRVKMNRRQDGISIGIDGGPSPNQLAIMAKLIILIERQHGKSIAYLEHHSGHVAIRQSIAKLICELVDALKAGEWQIFETTVLGERQLSVSWTGNGARYERIIIDIAIIAQHPPREAPIVTDIPSISTSGRDVVDHIERYYDGKTRDAVFPNAIDKGVLADKHSIGKISKTSIGIEHEAAVRGVRVESRGPPQAGVIEQ